MRRVDTNHIDARTPQRRHARLALRTDADRRADPQPAHLILARMRIANCLVHILDGDQAAQPILIVDQRQLLNPMRLQELLRMLRGRFPAAP